MMTVKALPAVLLFAILSATSLACGGGDDTDKTPTANESYAEGTVRLEIEYLDTGLLKGHAFADASSGYTVKAVSVQAVDHRGGLWNVLEPEVTGLGSATAQSFFEVVIQEIPRGKQLTVTATATFEDDGGNSVERIASDIWPP